MSFEISRIVREMFLAVKRDPHIIKVAGRGCWFFLSATTAVEAEEKVKGLNLSVGDPTYKSEADELTR